MGDPGQVVELTAEAARYGRVMRCRECGCVIRDPGDGFPLRPLCDDCMEVVEQAAWIEAENRSMTVNPKITVNPAGSPKITHAHV